jgi:hypothetical protein
VSFIAKNPHLLIKSNHESRLIKTGSTWYSGCAVTAFCNSCALGSRGKFKKIVSSFSDSLPGSGGE